MHSIAANSCLNYHFYKYIANSPLHQEVCSLFECLQTVTSRVILVSVTWLLTLDTHSMQASLPPDIRSVIHAFIPFTRLYQETATVPVRMLNFAMRIVPQGRSFISHLLVFLSQAESSSWTKQQSLIWQRGTSSSKTGTACPCLSQ